jgi:hypothetical protein
MTDALLWSPSVVRIAAAGMTSFSHEVARRTSALGMPA